MSILESIEKVGGSGNSLTKFWMLSKICSLNQGTYQIQAASTKLKKKHLPYYNITKYTMSNKIRRFFFSNFVAFSENMNYCLKKT